MASVPANPSTSALSLHNNNNNTTATSNSSSAKLQSLDCLIFEYLKEKGYVNLAVEFQQALQEKQGNEENTTIQENETSQEKKPVIDISIPAIMKKYSALVGMDEETSKANYLLFYGLNHGTPAVYSTTYQRLVEFVCNSLEMHKYDLYSLLFPLFCYAFLDLISKCLYQESRKFFDQFGTEFLHSYREEIQQLSMVVHISHLSSNEYAASMLHNKYPIALSLLSYELLILFLSDKDMLIMLALINQRMRITIKPSQDVKNHAAINMPQKTTNGYVAKLIEPQDESLTSESYIKKWKEDPSKGLPMAAHTLSFISKAINGVPIRWGAYPMHDKPTDILSSIAGNTNGTENDNSSATVSPSHSAMSSTTPIKKTDFRQKGKGRRHENPIASLAEIVDDTVVIPKPDDPFNREILEKLIFPELDTLRRRHKEKVDNYLGYNGEKVILPSCLCMTFSKDTTSVGYNIEGDVISAGYEDGKVKLWNYRKEPQNNTTKHERSEPFVLFGHKGAVHSTAITPDSRFVISASMDSTARLWSTDLASNISVYSGHFSPIWDIDVSPYNYYFCTASMDRTVRLWTLDRLHSLRLFAGHLSDVNACRFHPNSTLVGTGSDDRTSRIYDIRTGKCVRLFDAHHSGIQTITFSPNGRLMATTGDDTYINIWDIGEGRLIDTLYGHKSTVYSAEFSQEGNLLITSSDDETLKIWDTNQIGVKRNATQGWTTTSALYKTWNIKNSRIFKLHFTSKNLLLAGGKLKE